MNQWVTVFFGPFAYTWFPRLRISSQSVKVVTVVDSRNLFDLLRLLYALMHAVIFQALNQMTTHGFVSRVVCGILGDGSTRIPLGSQIENPSFRRFT